MMTNTEHSLFEQLQVVVKGNVSGLVNACNLSEEEWIRLLSISQQQGVYALVFEALDALYKEGKRLSVPKNIVLDALSKSMLTQKNYSNQIESSAALAKLWKEKGYSNACVQGFGFKQVLSYSVV